MKIRTFTTILGQAVREAVMSESRKALRGLEPNRTVDPICGMKIALARAAATREHEGMLYYFCSPGCARQFDADAYRFTHENEKGQAHH
jgi:Cu+-exporting ATPase